MDNFQLPPIGFGAGSQPPEEDGKELEYMQLPQDMRTYSAHVPDVAADPKLAPALTLLAEIGRAAERTGRGGANESFDLATLDPENRALIAETMGEGEVSMRMHGVPAVAAQESVFAGIWGLHGAGIDRIEVGPVPMMARTRAFAPRKPAAGQTAPRQPGVLNAPPLLVELEDKSATHDGDAPHVVNLTLLPHTEEDLAWLDTALGLGSVDILSRGYGNCRVTATALHNVWRVQFFNSMDTLILDTFEVTPLPEVALAAPEDLTDSAERVAEVLGAIT